MYFGKTTNLEDTTKEQFLNINNQFEVETWAKSQNITEIKKAITFIEKALSLSTTNSSSDKYLRDEYSLITENVLSENEFLNNEMISYIFNDFCNNQSNKLESRKEYIIANLAKNPSTPENIKLDILEFCKKSVDHEPFILSRLAENPNNSAEFLEDLYRNHQYNFVEFRSGMGHSFFNKAIASNSNTSNQVKISMIEDFPNLVSEKIKEFSNASGYEYSFNEIFKKLAENESSSNNVMNSLFEARHNFSKIMEYTYIIAEKTSDNELLDKIAKSDNVYRGTFKTLLRNSNLSSETVDSILNGNTNVPTSEISTLAFNQVLNSEQLSKVCENLGNYHISNIEEILAYSTCDTKVCAALLKNYSNRRDSEEKVLIIKEKMQELEQVSEYIVAQEAAGLNDDGSEIVENLSTGIKII